MADKPHLHVEFIMQPVEDRNASREAGRPIFTEKEFCRIRWAGDNKRELVEPAHQFIDRDPETNMGRTYAQKFAEHYRLFKANQDQSAVNGTPLSEVPFLTEAKRAELRALNIMSLESLAGLDGPPLKRLGMGGRELVNQAKAWLDKAAGAALETRLAGENAALREEIEAMKAQIASLANKPAAAPKQEPVSSGPSPFAEWQDEDIKVFIQDRTGSRPRGNPSHDTLVSMADDILVKEREEAEAA